MSAMRFGSDMGFVICEESASIPIKCYSPDLIVYPYLKQKLHETERIEDIMEKVCKILDKLHAIIIGPGLSTNEILIRTAELIIKECKQRSLPIVLDADGLSIIKENPGLIESYEKAILTPNKIEFERLCKTKNIKETEEDKKLRELCSKMGNITIIKKGKVDLISNGRDIEYFCDEKSAIKRCGGQGDVLTGILGCLLAFGQQYKNKSLQNDDTLTWKDDIPMLCAYIACKATRKSSLKAFSKFYRSMQTQDILQFVGESYNDLFGDCLHKDSNL